MSSIGMPTTHGKASFLTPRNLVVRMLLAWAPTPYDTVYDLGTELNIA